MKSSFAKLFSKIFPVIIIGLALSAAAAPDSPPPAAPAMEAAPGQVPPAPPSNMGAPSQIIPPPAPPSGSAPSGMMMPNPSMQPAPAGAPVELNQPPAVNPAVNNAPITPAAPAPAKPIKKTPKKSKSKHTAKVTKGIPASMRHGHVAAPETKAVEGKNAPEIQHALHNLFPNEAVGLETMNNGIAVTGRVSDTETAHRIVEVVGQFLPKGAHIMNMMQIKTNQQVMLRVRIGEIKRTAAKGFGLLTLNELEHDGLFKTLAEPNLVAISGESANFLSGGEFPVPVSSDEGTTVQYKNYGIGLQFTPIVISQNRIRLTVASEVSDLSTKGQVKTNGFSIPSLTERKAKTTVELAPGESYMIAGLLKDNVTVKTANVSGIGDIPVLGALFRDTDTDRNETELVIAVTPYLVDPVKAKDVRLPSDDYHTPSQMETILFGSLGAMDDSDKVQLQNPKAAIPGDFGFMTE